MYIYIYISLRFLCLNFLMAIYLRSYPILTSTSAKYLVPYRYLVAILH